jgi:hypothetical protein
LYAGLHLRTLPVNLLALTAVGGLALLFWEARDGTRAAMTAKHTLTHHSGRWHWT